MVVLHIVKIMEIWAKISPKSQSHVSFITAWQYILVKYKQAHKFPRVPDPKLF